MIAAKCMISAEWVEGGRKRRFHRRATSVTSA
jgi:hypothetical protein